ncbi:MAG: FecR domain-containing protein, partial [Pseudomonadota bacterium]
MTSDLSPKTEKALIEDASAWRVLLNDPKATEEDHRRFDMWLKADPRHEDAFDRVVTVWEAFGRLDQGRLSPDLLRPTLFECARLARRILIGRVSRPRLQVIAAVTAAAAVVVAVAFIEPWAHPGLRPTVEAPVLASTETGRAETATLILADGSRVTLGAMSAVEATFTAKARAVRLVRGAAFFEVAEDPTRPFTVQSGSFKATVIGTTFEIRTAPDVVRLAVAEGSVRASYPLIAGGRAQ